MSTKIPEYLSVANTNLILAILEWQANQKDVQIRGIMKADPNHISEFQETLKNQGLLEHCNFVDATRDFCTFRLKISEVDKLLQTDSSHIKSIAISQRLHTMHTR